MKHTTLLQWICCFISILFCMPSLAAEIYHVVFSQDTLANDWRLAQVKDVERVLSQHENIKFEVLDAQGDTARQVLQIEQLLYRHIDVLITSPRQSLALTSIIRQIYKKGVPVVLLDRGIEDDTYTSFVHPENRHIGRAAGQWLANNLNGRGTIFMLEGVPGASPTRHRTEGFLEVIKQYPELKVVSRVANYLRADAIHATEQLLDKNIKFDAIYAQSDSMAEGARMVMKRYGLNLGKTPVVGVDYIEAAKQAILKGEQAVSFTYPTGGKEGAEIVVDILQGKPVPKEIVIPSKMVTIENVNLVKPIF